MSEKTLNVYAAASNEYYKWQESSEYIRKKKKLTWKSIFSELQAVDFSECQNCCGLTETSGWDGIKDIPAYMEWKGMTSDNDFGGGFFWTGQKEQQKETVNRLEKAGWTLAMEFPSRMNPERKLVMLTYSSGDKND